MSDSVHYRNARALDERNKLMTGEIDVLRTRLAHLENQTAMLVQAVQLLEQRLTVILVSRGNGPSESRT